VFDSGHVRIFRNYEDAWIQVGNTLVGEGSNDQSGKAISLSDDGSVVAIGAIYNDGDGTDRGHVRIYQNVDGTWTKTGDDIKGAISGDHLGNSVSLSSDGSIIAIGAVQNDENINSNGYVSIYKNLNNKWTQIGDDIEGTSKGDLSGFSVTLSNYGNNRTII
jgi:hypothetical protein